MFDMIEVVLYEIDWKRNVLLSKNTILYKT